MPRFYTKNGDDGYTGLLGEGRTPKYDPRIEAVGNLDEASAALGVARVASLAADTADILITAQRHLYHLMAEVAATPEQAARFRVIENQQVAWLEEQTDRLSSLVSLPKGFILPGDSPAGAAMALARAIVRRAERSVARLLHANTLENQYLLHYLNRLSSLCFVLELYENQAAGRSQPTLAKE